MAKQSKHARASKPAADQVATAPEPGAIARANAQRRLEERRHDAEREAEQPKRLVRIATEWRNIHVSRGTSQDPIDYDHWRKNIAHFCDVLRQENAADLFDGADPTGNEGVALRLLKAGLLDGEAGIASVFDELSASDDEGWVKTFADDDLRFFGTTYNRWSGVEHYRWSGGDGEAATLDHRHPVAVVREVMEKLEQFGGKLAKLHEEVSTAGAAVPVVLVDVEKLTVTYKGKTEDIGSDLAARWLKVLTENPGKRIPGPELKQYDPELYDPRTDRLKDELPARILKLIDTTKRGSRLIPK